MIDQAVESALNKTDLEPGEVNDNIKKVMNTMDESYKQFQSIKKYLERISTETKKLNKANQQTAESALEVAKVTQELGEEIEKLNKNTTEMQEALDELNETISKFENHVPDEDSN